MSKLSTLNYLISSFNAGLSEVEKHQLYLTDSTIKNGQFEFEPSQKSIDAILNFASQYDVIKSEKAGSIELNLN